MKLTIRNLINAETPQETSVAIKELLDSVYGRKRFNRNPLTEPKTDSQRFFDKLAFGLDSCWFWVACRNKQGYGQINMLGEKKAHRVAWRLFRGEIPKGCCVLHKCDVTSCVNPDHLFLGTQEENIQDMIKKNRQSFPLTQVGDKNPMSKLTDNKVLEIRKRYASEKTSCKKLGKEYGVSPMTINRIVNKKLWKHI